MSYPIDIRRGDDVVGPIPASANCLVKVDVEGFELEVLRGFRSVWSRTNTMVICEVSPKWLQSASGQWGHNAQSRLETWQAFREDATAQVWLFGQGRTAGQVRQGLATHSSYVSGLFVLGIGGLIWVQVFFGTLARWARRLARMRVEPYATIAGAVLSAPVVWVAAGVAIDMLLGVQLSCVYLFFAFFAILIEPSYGLARRAAPAAQLAAARTEAPEPPPLGYVQPTTSAPGLHWSK